MNLALNQPHNSGCLKQYGLLLDRHNRRAFCLPIWRGRWDCAACATKKLGELMQHLASRNTTLCWGVYTKAKINQARQRGIGTMTLTYTDGARMMVAGSHLYEPPMPALTVIQQVVKYTATRQISRVGWSDNWRPDEQGDPLRWRFLNTDTTDLRQVNKALERAGVVDGSFRGQDADDLAYKIEQILNGVTFNSGN